MTGRSGVRPYIYRNMKLEKASKKEKVEKLYFVAIVPPSPIYEEAIEQKMYFKTKYNSKASLNSPPHITLHMPFRWVEKNEDELASHLEKFARDNDAINIKLNGFSSFPPKVIFINVEITAELETLQRNLERHFKRQMNLFNANYKEQPFHPHLTLAFRDLKKPNYQKAWEEFVGKNYQAEFLAHKLALLKHSGSVWEVFQEFELSSRKMADR
jgi:2'-5' RNA ligase